MHDLVVRSGRVVDGTGAPPRVADVAVDDGIVTETGDEVGSARREIHADGLLVTPGWVDIHTHYDGQVTWDPYLSPSGWHGVTSVVMGNCGVGFAPVDPDRHDWLIGLMEGVEDIPGTALAEGIDWKWETFPEYLDALEAFPRAVDVGTQVPHGAVRAYVMGDRGAANEEPTADDLTAMAAIVREALEAGALGVSTSRTMLHRSIDGVLVPGTNAATDELLALGEAMGDVGHGTFEFVSDFVDAETEFEWMTRLSKAAARPVTFLLQQTDGDPTRWRRMLDLTDRAAEAGAWIVPQVSGRTTGLLMGLESSSHPLMWRKAYAPVAELPLAERVKRLRDPELRQAIVSEEVDLGHPLANFLAKAFHKLFPLGDPPDYEPDPERSVQAMAEREGREPMEVAYDLLLEDDGHQLLYFPLFNYTDGDLEAAKEMLEHPRSVVGLSDGGAHCGLICDASLPTFMLTHWARDRSRGDRLEIEDVVRAQTRDTARLYGLADRGTLEPGMKADLNVLDFDRLALRRPHMVYDLPGDARRLVQEAEGYVATVAAGEVTFEEGEATGALPGRLIRGPQSA